MKRNGLFYLNIGASYEYGITEKLFLDFGFNVYQIMNDIEAKYSFTQYVVGLNYILGKGYE